MHYYTIHQIAQLLSITERTVYNYIKQGKLKAVKIGKYWHIPEEALQELLKGDNQ